MLDELGRNEDPADTYGQLTELAGRPWTRALNTVTSYLLHTSLNNPEHQRAVILTEALGRVRSTVTELEATQLGGTSTGLSDMLTIETDQ